MNGKVSLRIHSVWYTVELMIVYRWVMLTGSSMGARIAVEECFKWAMQRKVRDSNNVLKTSSDRVHS